MRRTLAAAAAVGLGILITAPSSAAQENPAYDGSRISTPAAVPSGAPTIEALIVRTYNHNNYDPVVRTYLTTPGGLPPGCGAAGEHELPTTLGDAAEPNTIHSVAIGDAPCNGTYAIRITAILKRKTILVANDTGTTLTGEVKIVAPPGNLSGVTGAVEGSTVVLSWPALSSPPPDLTGYRVYRLGSGDPVKLGETGPNERTFTDTSPPPEGGSVTYQVKARRDAPGHDVESTGGGKVTVSGVPTGSTTSVTTETSTDGGGTGGGTGAGTGGGTGGGTGTGGTTGGGTTAGTDGGTKGSTTGGSTKKSGRSFAPLSDRGVLGVGTKAPRLGQPASSNIAALVTPDEGFSEELDYGDGLAGGSDDGLASIDYEDGAVGKGMAVPVATGFVFAAWAFHLRYLARAAKPVKARPRYGSR